MPFGSTRAKFSRNNIYAVTPIQGRRDLVEGVEPRNAWLVHRFGAKSPRVRVSTCNQSDLWENTRRIGSQLSVIVLCLLVVQHRGAPCQLIFCYFIYFLEWLCKNCKVIVPKYVPTACYRNYVLSSSLKVSSTYKMINYCNVFFNLLFNHAIKFQQLR